MKYHCAKCGNSVDTLFDPDNSAGACISQQNSIKIYHLCGKCAKEVDDLITGHKEMGGN